MTRPKIMIVGAGDFQLPLVETAAKDYEVILVAPSVDERFKKFASKIYYSDVRKKDDILEIARTEQISGVITDQTDIPVYTVAYIAERLGLPGITTETARLFTDKTAMREKLVELGLPVLPHETTSNIREAVDFFRKINAPCIIKPLNNQGSRGVFKISNEEELRKKYPETSSYSTDGRVLTEKFVSGPEFVIESAVVDFHSETLISGDTEYFDIPDAFAAKTRIFPSARPPSLRRKAEELNKKIIEGFGLKQGITHGEYIVDGEDVYLIEIGARGGGVFISSDLIFLSTGLDTERFLLNLALGKQQNLPKAEKQKCVCGYLAFFLPEGTVTEVGGIEEIKALPYVGRHQLDKLHTGLRIGKATDKTSRFALILSADSREEFDRRAEFIKRTLNVKTFREGKELSPIWA